MKIWSKRLENAELFVPKMRFHCYLCSKPAEFLIRIVITHLGSSLLSNIEAP
uniref:Uncharacterized protein n=1 Tax=Tetranychus urticae TaxID=32264 RepID=T1L005_TETUR